ncbi:MAG: SIS domain-containing protein [Candidatus Dependentiae bacterium]|jgi:arabinose-5-phosphate isomerase
MTAAARPDSSNIQNIVIQTFAAEQAVLATLAAAPPVTLASFISLLRQTTGKVVFSGLGKSWHVAQLLAATFSSVRIPAYALHGTEALHGDGGVLQQNDTLVVISKSGRGAELAALLRMAAHQGCRTALMTCDAGALTSFAEVTLTLPLSREAGEFGIVPTSSIIMMISCGHAAALQIAHDRGFVPNHFAQVHPAGSLGVQLGADAKEKE